MKAVIRGIIPLVAALLFTSNALAADPYLQTIQLFRNAAQSTRFFRTCYGYAVFPTIGEGGLGIGAVAITVGANVSANTSGGTSAGASGGRKDAGASGAYRHGVAVLAVAKGGLMYQAAVQRQRFSYKALGSK